MTPPSDPTSGDFDPRSIVELRPAGAFPAHVWSCCGGEGVSYPNVGAAWPRAAPAEPGDSFYELDWVLLRASRGTSAPLGVGVARRASVSPAGAPWANLGALAFLLAVYE